MKYVLYIREAGSKWWWGWYLVRIFDLRERADEEIEWMRTNATPGTQVALLEWTPDNVNPLDTQLYFRWPKNSKLLFRRTVARRNPIP